MADDRIAEVHDDLADEALDRTDGGKSSFACGWLSRLERS